MSGATAGDTGGIGPEDGMTLAEAVELDQEALDARLTKVEEGVERIQGKLVEAAGRVEELLAAEKERDRLRGLVRFTIAFLAKSSGDDDLDAAVRRHLDVGGAAPTACGCPPCSTCSPACIFHVEGCPAGAGVSPGT